MRRALGMCVSGLLAGLLACGRGGGLESAPQRAFALTLLDGTLQAAPANYFAEPHPDGEGLRVVVAVQRARDLNALYIALRYDSSRWQLVEARPTPEFGTDAIHLAIAAAPGLLHYGAVLPAYEQREGFSGSGELAVLSFRRGAADAAPAAPVRSAGSAGPLVELSWDAATNHLSWPYGVAGDYDQNGEVGIADLTPLGRFFGVSGPFEAAQLESQVDGDGNAEVNLADLTPIGQHFGEQAESYRLYYAHSESSLPGAGKEDDPGLVSAEPEFAAALGKPGTERLRFDYSFGAAAPNGWVWVRPHLNPPTGASYDGPASAVLRLGSATPGNLPPLAAFSADVLSGPAPLSVNVDAAASSDPDGSITEYEWDWNGDGDGWHWEASSGPTASHVFETEGSYTVTLRVTDDQDASAFAYQIINVQADPNLPPTGTLAPIDGLLRKGHEITFEASELADTETYVHLLEWDLDGDGSFVPVDGWDGVARDDETWTFPEPGDYFPAVRLTDTEGASTIVSISIHIAQDLPPQAALSANPPGGTAPLSVDFDASASTDDFVNGIDGIVSLHWTVNCETNPALSHQGGCAWSAAGGHWLDSLPAAGEYEVTVEVMDAAYQTSSATTHVSVSGIGLHTADYDTDDRCSWLDGEIIAGRPAVVYARSIGTGEATVAQLLYARAEDALGESWGEPVVVDDQTGWFGGNCSLLELDGKPAVGWFDGSNVQMLYSRALDANGQSWTAPVVLTEGVNIIGYGPIDLALINEKLGVLCSNSSQIVYREALDPLGDAWGPPGVVWEDLMPGWALSLADVGGHPGALFFDLGHIHYCRALDSAGQSWPDALLLHDYAGSGESCTSMKFMLVGGRPACYFSGYFLRADDDLGETWPEPTPVDREGYGDPSRNCLALIGGRLVALDGYLSCSMIQCNDGLGDDWQAPSALLAQTMATDLLDMGGFPGIFHDSSFSTLR